MGGSRLYGWRKGDVLSIDKTTGVVVSMKSGDYIDEVAISGDHYAVRRLDGSLEMFQGTAHIGTVSTRTGPGTSSLVAVKSGAFCMRRSRPPETLIECWSPQLAAVWNKSFELPCPAGAWFTATSIGPELMVASNEPRDRTRVLRSADGEVIADVAMRVDAVVHRGTDVEGFLSLPGGLRMTDRAGSVLWTAPSITGSSAVIRSEAERLYALVWSKSSEPIEHPGARELTVHALDRAGRVLWNAKPTRLEIPGNRFNSRASLDVRAGTLIVTGMEGGWDVGSCFVSIYDAATGGTKLQLQAYERFAP